MKRIIFWGDGLLCGKEGYGELLGDHIFLHHPRTDINLALHGTPGIELKEAMREAPFHIIGKDPDLLFLAFGHSDIALRLRSNYVLKIITEVANLVLQKTRAHICIPTLMSSFFYQGDFRDRCDEVNGEILKMGMQRVTIMDLNKKVQEFLEEHRQSQGDIKALHIDSERLTSLGQLFLSHHAYLQMPWPSLDSEPYIAPPPNSMGMRG